MSLQAQENQDKVPDTEVLTCAGMQSIALDNYQVRWTGHVQGVQRSTTAENSAVLTLYSIYELYTIYIVL